MHASDMDATLRELEESHIDGRATYLRYRQRQIMALYNAISKYEEEFVQAIQSDVGKCDFEARLEVTLVLRSLKLAFDQSDFKTLTERVHTLKKGGCIATGYGAALIIGHWTSPLDTVVSPLSAAIIAGNVALALLPENARNLQNLFDHRVYPSLDISAYPIRLADKSTLETVLRTPFHVYAAVSTDIEVRKQLVLAAADSVAPVYLTPAGKPDLQNVCIVSKTAERSDLPRIASLIVRASAGALAGQSLGAISFVCAHEQIHDDLVKELVNAAQRIANATADVSTPRVQTSSAKVNGYHGNEEGGKTVFQEAIAGGKCNFRIVESVEPSSSLLNGGSQALTLPVVPFTSTEQALQIVAPRLGQVLNVFSDQLELDYFATELRPHIATSNDIPVQLLAGIYPTTQLANSPLRWVSSMFERPIRVHEHAKGDEGIFAPYAKWQIELLRKTLLPVYIKELKLKLKPHSNIIRRVFFLQGLFLSLSVILGTTAIAGSYGGFRAFRYFFR